MSTLKTNETQTNGGGFFFIIFIGLLISLCVTGLITVRQNETTRRNRLRQTIRLVTEDIEKKEKQLHNYGVSLEHFTGEQIKNYAASLQLRPPHPGQLVIYDALGRRVNDLTYGEDSTQVHGIASSQKVPANRSF